jgi:benzoylformate decarboxylase
MTTMAGRKAIFEIFEQQGVRFISGNPGTTELGFMDILKDYPRIQYVLALQESIALGIAHAYANASGKTGVVNLHVAPGLGNALGALYNACVGKVPLVVTAGQQDTRMLAREPVLSHDLVSMARPLTKWAVQLHHAEEIPVILPRAFKVTQDPPRGPVFLSLPSNVLDEEIEFEPPEAGASYRQTRPDPEGVAAAADLLARAEHPVIICGDGVASARAQEDLVAMAETLGAPVWNTLFMGALSFPATHPHFQGQLMGEYSAIQRMLNPADVVLAVGANLFDEVFYSAAGPLPPGCKLIQLDDSPWELGKNLSPAVSLLADLRPSLRELLEAIESHMDQEAKQKAEARRTALAEQKEQARMRQKNRAEDGWNSIPISPARLMADLQTCLPKNAVIYNEAITASADLLRTLPLSEPETFFGNHGGGIGQGMPGALGVKLAKPDQPVIALIGDGSAMYTIQSLWTAAHYHLDVVYIILSNQSYRILKYNMNRYRRGLKEPSGLFPAMDLIDPPLDFVKIAAGHGVPGRLVDHPDDIIPALEQALSTDGPYLLEIRTEGRIPP